MGLYTRLAATATRLITDYGRALTIGTPPRSVRGVRVEMNPFKERASAFGFTGGEGNEVGDVRFLLEAAANPAYAERLTAGAASYIILSIDPISPADTVLAWLVTGRIG